jgi:hypothetical protein
MGGDEAPRSRELSVRRKTSEPPYLANNGIVAARKPTGVSFKTWIDKRIRMAQERDDFDNLPGAGKRIRGPEQAPYEQWWVNSYVRREEVPTEVLLPTPLPFCGEIERLPIWFAIYPPSGPYAASWRSWTYGS